MQSNNICMYSKLHESYSGRLASAVSLDHLRSFRAALIVLMERIDSYLD